MRNDFQHLLVEQDGAVLTIIMNRPEKLNAFNDVMLQEMIEVTEAAARDDAIRCVVITGAGRAFGSGQDLTSFAPRSNTGNPPRVSEHLTKYHRLVLALRGMPKPVIAAVAHRARSRWRWRLLPASPGRDGQVPGNVNACRRGERSRG